MFLTPDGKVCIAHPRSRMYYFQKTSLLCMQISIVSAQFTNFPGSYLFPVSLGKTLWQSMTVNDPIPATCKIIDS